MKQPSYDPKALRDLEAIAYAIAQDNPDRAATFVAELRQRAQQAAEAPKIFPSRNELVDGLRSVRHGAYLIFFVERDDGILVVRVLHGARDLHRLFGI